MTELALTKKLAEKSKDIDDITARLEAMRTSQWVTETHIRDFIVRMQEHTKRIAQVEHAHAEVTR